MNSWREPVLYNKPTAIYSGGTVTVSLDPLLDVGATDGALLHDNPAPLVTTAEVSARDKGAIDRLLPAHL